jgi:hypothetical protein
MENSSIRLRPDHFWQIASADTDLKQAKGWIPVGSSLFIEDCLIKLEAVQVFERDDKRPHHLGGVKVTAVVV